MTQEARVLTGIAVGTVVLLLVTVFFLTQGQTAQSSSNSVDISLLTKNAVHVTNQKAKVTVVEFADFQCPACARAYPALEQLKEEYKDQVNFVYRNFPLPQHKNALSAINAAEAAGEQSKYWEMSQLLYTRQSEWSESDHPEEIFVSYAKELGIDQNQFTNDFAANKYQSRINLDLQDGRTLEVNSTPTVYINGSKFSQNPVYQFLKTQLDQELQKSN